ncbi:MAG: hypothetical protein M1837_007186 [Sclerophora amabilis]|nr:MAG: hypothetical protein M1837_007186 [Sclerophora amabilis]
MLAYHPAFQVHLVDHGVYPDMYDYPGGHRELKLDNWAEIQQRLQQPRVSLSLSRFSDGVFRTFRKKTKDASNETEVMTNLLPTIQGDSDNPSGMKRMFTNLTPLTDGTIVDAQPDFYYGARPQQLDPRIRRELSSDIIPSKDRSVPILPNHFTEGKGPKWGVIVAERQALYDGALGARAMHRLQSYGEPLPIYDNNAYTITSYYCSGLLSIFTVHLTEPRNPGDRPEYHMNQLGGWSMTGDPETFRKGATAYRNARDWAGEKRDELIKAANEKAVALSQDRSVGSSHHSEPSNSND